MTIKRRTANHAYVGALSVTATLLALVFAASAPAGASAHTRSPARSQAAVMSALAARGAVVHPGSGYRPHGSPIVRGLQALLVRVGYPLAVDGHYGPLTAQAVMRYQANLGLPATGVAGPRTLAALSAGGVALRRGAGYPGGSRAVRHLQQLLVSAGSSPGPIDGLYGPLTARAVRRYQAAQGLPVSGIAGRRTLAALPEAGGGAPGNSAVGNGRAGGGEAGGGVLHPGAGYEVGGSSAVRHLQRLLARAGYPPGPVDGRYGPLTARAVRRYQAAKGLPVNGAAGSRTLSDLRSSSSARHASPRKTRTAPQSPSTAAAPAVPAPAASPPPKARPARDHPPPISILRIVLLGLLAVGLCGAALAYVHNRRRAGFIRSRHGHPDPSTQPQAAHPVSTRNRDGNGNERSGDGAGAVIDVNAVFEFGVLLEESGDLAAAGAAYRRADERGHATAASNLGVLLEAQGDRSQAEAAYRRAARRGGASGAFNLGVSLEERDDLAGAEAAYRHAAGCDDPEVAELARVALEELVAETAGAGADATGSAAR